MSHTAKNLELLSGGTPETTLRVSESEFVGEPRAIRVPNPPRGWLQAARARSAASGFIQ
jgi:hypothetical protein